MKVRLKFLQNLVVIALCFGTFVLPTTSFAWDASSAYDCGKGGDFPMTFAGCRAGYYYEDWENADASLTPDKIGECLECPDGYACYGGFAGPVSGASCQVGYYGSGANCTPCTNKPANSTYTGAAATNSCSWTCDSGYTKVGTSCIIPYEYDAGGSMYNCNIGHFPMAFAGCRAGYYYEDWENADASLLPDEIGECLECPDGYTCAGGFAGPEVPSPCATGYYGATIESCTPCTNKPAHSTYTGAAATNSCPWECDSGYNENNGTCSLCTANQILVNGACQNTKFTVTTTKDTDEFGFYLSAAGTFYIDWGDGTVETINRINDTSYTKYEHQYASAKKYTVRFGGAATDYNTADYPTITFNEGYACFDECESNWAQNIASITGDLGEIFGAVQSGNMPKFISTFATAPITSIPSGLFASIDTSNATNTVSMFFNTFYGCSNLTAIPASLFASIDISSATNTSDMFSSTFGGCSNLTDIPSGLFGSIDTSNATNTTGMFYRTFYYCSNLTAIPAGLFASIDTSNATNTSGMFSSTFSGCSDLTSIPTGLFDSIDTSNATNTSNMFYYTFSDCSNLTAIPAGLFASIDTSNATDTGYMFYRTFNNCSNLTGFIPPSAFAGLIANGSPTANGMWQDTFAGTRLAKTCPSGMTEYNTGYKDAWGGYVSCEIDYPFTLTTTSTNSFQFKLSAAGTFYVDCGNGGTLSGTNASGKKISRGSSTTDTTYSCSWGTSAAHTIRFGGTATDYNTDTTTAAISFYTQTNANKVASISGDLGKIFGRVQSNRIPRFYQTFYGCSNLTAIPAGLFASIDTSNATDTSYMFVGTFHFCSNLTTIPNGLFDSIDTSNATNTSFMFNGTFADCGKLTAIPNGLFASIDTSSATNTSFMFASTFSRCSNLTAIPNGVFASIDTSSATNTRAMFSSTFYYCSNLTAIPNGLFDSIATSNAINTRSMFENTFLGCSNLTAIPSGLFNSIDTSNATNTSYMFSGTFRFCSNLTTIPNGLFASIDTSSATDTSYMFQQTFDNCNNLTAIPAGLFDSIDTSNATNTSNMFSNTFYKCSNLTAIPNGLFDSINTSKSTNTSYMFYQTFSLCSNLTAIPNGLFDSIDTSSATNTSGMFSNTFIGCSNLTAIPTGLFDSIDTSSATNTSSMFQSTFSLCSNLTAIPNGLFNSIDTAKSTDTSTMFSNTFYNCSNLTAIPTGLFNSIDTAKSTDTSAMFFYTFKGCSELTTIPAGLFDSIDTSSATNTSYMFYQTFINCSNLTAIPKTLFNPNISMAKTTSYNDMFKQMFYGCSNLTGYIPSTTFPVGLNVAKSTFTNAFSGTQLATTCPAETELYDTYDGKVACTLLNVDCTAGYYLPANVNECAICPINSVCVGGNYPLSETIDQGIQSCANGTFAPTGSAVCYPHILHVGDSNVYLKSTKQTTPSLNIKIGNDVFYANMTTERTSMNKDSSHYLHVKTADNVHYYVCDDTTCPQ